MSSFEDRSAPNGGRPDRRRLRLGLGLLLTFAGLFLAAYLLPSPPAALARTLPIAAGALLALWLGGMLLGTTARR